MSTKTKKWNVLASLMLCGVLLLASSQYYLYENKLLNRTDIRDKTGKNIGYLKENRTTGRTEIRDRNGRRTGEIHHKNTFNRIEVRDRKGRNRLYLKKSPFMKDRMNIFRSIDGRRVGEVRHNQILDRMEVKIDEVK